MARRRVCQSRRVPPTRSGLAPRVTEGSPLFCETEALSAGGGAAEGLCGDVETLLDRCCFMRS